MADIHAARRAKAQQKIAESGADAALITAPANVRYLSGLVSSNAAILLPADGPAVLATDSRYAEAAERDCPGHRSRDRAGPGAGPPELAVALGYSTLAFEAQDMTVERHAALAERRWSRTGTPGTRRRGPADDQGRSRDRALARACAITAEAFAGVLREIVPGRTERDFAVLLERAMIDLGAEGLLRHHRGQRPERGDPHHSPGDRAFEAGDLITIDCGARYGGYHADMTRTVALGQPAGWQREIYDLVATAQLSRNRRRGARR